MELKEKITDFVESKLEYPTKINFTRGEVENLLLEFNQSQQSKWISVEEMLPKDYNRYLCLRLNDEKQCLIEDVCLFDSKDKEWLFNRQEVDVRFWKPLPENPKSAE